MSQYGIAWGKAVFCFCLVVEPGQGWAIQAMSVRPRWRALVRYFEPVPRFAATEMHCFDLGPYRDRCRSRDIVVGDDVGGVRGGQERIVARAATFGWASRAVDAWLDIKSDEKYPLAFYGGRPVVSSWGQRW